MQEHRGLRLGVGLHAENDINVTLGLIPCVILNAVNHLSLKVRWDAGLDKPPPHKPVGTRLWAHESFQQCGTIEKVHDQLLLLQQAVRH